MVQQTKTFGQEWGWLVSVMITAGIFLLSTYRSDNTDIADKMDKLDAKITKSIEKIADDNNLDHSTLWRAFSGVNVRTVKLETKHGIDSQTDLTYNGK